MTEPEYVYRKGEGWVITINPVLGMGDTVPEWIKIKLTSQYDDFKYPSFCSDYKVLQGVTYAKDLLPGDVIPYSTFEARLIVSVNPTSYKILSIRFIRDRAGHEYSFMGGPFRCVVRPL